MIIYCVALFWTFSKVESNVEHNTNKNNLIAEKCLSDQ